MNEGDWEDLCRALLTLLDRIECGDDVSQETHDLCQQRFNLVRNYGMTIEMTGEPISGAVQ